MDKDLIRKYKEDTGKGFAFVDVTVESTSFIPKYVLISYEEAKATGIWRDELIVPFDIMIPSQEYVNWLEEQLKEKMK